MMSLEIIVGTDLVLLLSTYDNVESLMMDIRPHIPMVTYHLLDEMLFLVRDENVLKNANTDCFEAFYKIEEAINGIENAKMGNILIKARVDQYHAATVENGDQLAMKYSWKPSYEFE